MSVINAIFDFFFSAIRTVIVFTIIMGIIFLPLWLLVYFIVCVVRYRSAGKSWKQDPSNEAQKQIKNEYLLKMILSGVLTAAFATAWVVFYVTFIHGITNM